MTLAEFLIALGKSPAKRQKFLNQPLDVCNEHDLSQADREALRTNDPVAKATALGAANLSDEDWIVTKAEDWIVGTGNQ